jgi:hypothetical protein
MIAALFTVVIYIIVIGLIFGLLRYLIRALPLDEPFRRYADIALTVLAVLVIIMLLLSLTGTLDMGLPRLR